jgi:hypothetical protein
MQHLKTNTVGVRVSNSSSGQGEGEEEESSETAPSAASGSPEAAAVVTAVPPVAFAVIGFLEVAQSSPAMIGVGSVLMGSSQTSPELAQIVSEMILTSTEAATVNLTPPELAKIGPSPFLLLICPLPRLSFWSRV